MEEKVFAYIREHHMLEPGDRVVVGVSGGADSVCLLFMLLEWAQSYPLELTVVHVNHGVRREAGEDAAYVEALCRERGLPFCLVEKDVPALAAKEKLSEEEMGRKVRYEAFAEAAQTFHANKIAVAHNSNDRSETMLFHLFRGSGIKGLSSIQSVRDEIIRPILCLERREIENYLQERGIAYCQDATNGTDDYTRNRIRHHILPYAEEQIVQGCVQHMAQTAELLSETEDYLEQQTVEAMKSCVQTVPVPEGMNSEGQITGYQITVKEYQKYHPIIQKRILHSIMKALSPRQKDISYVHIKDVQELFVRPGNRMICLPFGIRARREYEKIIITRNQISDNTGTDEFSENDVFDIQITFPTRHLLGWTHEIMLGANWKLVCSILQMGNIIKEVQEVPSNLYTKWFDYDKIKGCITLRTRKKGDYFTISRGDCEMGHKSVKDYMIAGKIPRSERDRLLLLAEDKHVLWLLGHRISEYYKITENTKLILQVQLINNDLFANRTEEENGRTC